MLGWQDYRRALIKVVVQAAQSGFIPTVVRSDGYVIPLDKPQRAGYLIDQIAASDVAEDWYYVGALQPELGYCVTWLRRLRNQDDAARTA